MLLDAKGSSAVHFRRSAPVGADEASVRVIRMMRFPHAMRRGRRVRVVLAIPLIFAPGS